MAFFTSRPSASFYEPNYSGLFRLIDEFNNYAETQASNTAESDAAVPASTSQSVANPAAASKRRSLHNTMSLWTPKFDLHETPNTYVLHGEFPGIDKKDIHLEFIDEQTLSIRGRSERVQTHSSDDDESAAAAQGDKEQNGKEVAHQDKSKQQVTPHKDHQPKLKYWVSERSFGEFARSFTFPTRIDADGVVAKLENGVLNLVVPKAVKPQGKKITLQ